MSAFRRLHVLVGEDMAPRVEELLLSLHRGPGEEVVRSAGSRVVVAGEGASPAVVFEMNTSVSRAATCLSALKKIGVHKSGVISLLSCSALEPVPKEEHAFLATARPVEEIYEDIVRNAGVDFNFICSCIAAAVIAGTGLGTDSGVMITAAMLISPLMQPLLAVTFGTATLDWRAVCKGVCTLAVGVVIAVVVGLVLGGLLGPIARENRWPTPSMVDRGRSDQFYAQIIFATASGVAVGTAVSSTGQINSLVGVAISASLLPPLVNAGMCASFALVGPYFYQIVFHQKCELHSPGVPCPALTEAQKLLAKHHQYNKFARLAKYSTIVFLLNIVVIWLVCTIMFKLECISSFKRSSSNRNVRRWWVPRWANKQAGAGAGPPAGAGNATAVAREEGRRGRRMMVANTEHHEQQQHLLPNWTRHKLQPDASTAAAQQGQEGRQQQRYGTTGLGK